MLTPAPALRAAALSLALAAAHLAGAPAARAASVCEPDVTLHSGAVTRVCMSDSVWNGDLVVWAHGYVDFTRPVAIPEEQLCLGDTGFCLHEVVNALGFGFVTTSYRMNGMVTSGVEDVLDAVGAFAAAHAAPRRVYLLGASEGGLVTTLAVEQRPDVFAGGVAACGPIGDFERQVAYFGDFRVLFDYFFPGLLPGSPVEIPPDVIAGWDDLWSLTIKPAVFDPANASRLAQLLRTARAPYDAADPATQETTVEDALWYSVFATNDLTAKLGGRPFDNVSRVYLGSDDDAALNAGVARFAADPAAIEAMGGLFRTEGALEAPLVVLHTTKDQQVGFAQALLYGAKLRASGTEAQRVLFPAFRYGHCNFRPWEALLSFAILLARVEGGVPEGLSALLEDPAERLAFESAARRWSLGGARRAASRR
jgi:pimeloyl-ACP methyl ester carboxylesterase